MFAGALGIALVSLTDTISNSTAFAARSGQEVRGNQEMIGIGAANLAVGFFQGFPVSTSGSRTAVAERSGSKTQLTGVTGAVLVLLMLVLVPGLYKRIQRRDAGGAIWSGGRSRRGRCIQTTLVRVDDGKIGGRAAGVLEIGAAGDVNIRVRIYGDPAAKSTPLSGLPPPK